MDIHDYDDDTDHDTEDDPDDADVDTNDDKIENKMKEMEGSSVEDQRTIELDVKCSADHGNTTREA